MVILAPGEATSCLTVGFANLATLIDPGAFFLTLQDDSDPRYGNQC